MKNVLNKAQDNKTELEMTPMIDVVFLILIFFMCATKFKVPEGSLRSYLPRDRGSQSAPTILNRGCRVTLVNDEGEIHAWADEKLITNDSMGPLERERGFPGPSEQELMDHMTFRKNNYTGLSDKGLPVIIDFASDVPWKYVVQVLNICRRLDIADVAFAAPEIPID